MNTLNSGYRPFIWPWFRHYLNFRTYYYWLKYKIQRAQRGWADCDTWSLDNYLSMWLPNALRYLKKYRHGTPCSMFTSEELNYTHKDGCCYPPDNASKRAEKQWDEIMDKMILGFDAYNRATDGLYEDALGPYPLDPDFLKNINNPSTKMKERFKKSEELRKIDMKTFEDGAKLFIEYFESLWD